MLPSRSKLRYSPDCLSAHHTDTLQGKRKQALSLQSSHGTLEGPGNWNAPTFLCPPLFLAATFKLLSTSVLTFEWVLGGSQVQLTLEQHRFELWGSTYTWIFFDSKYSSTSWSLVGWIRGMQNCGDRGTAHTEGTISYIRISHCTEGWRP